MLCSSKKLIERHARDLGLKYLWDKCGSMEMHLQRTQNMVVNLKF